MDGDKRRNLKIVSDAMMVLQEPLQDYVISELKFMFGDEWWTKGVVGSRTAYLPVDLPLSEVDEEAARQYLDSSGCLSLVRKHRLVQGTTSSDEDSLKKVSDLKDIMLSVSKKDYGLRQSQEAVRCMMAVDDLMLLDCHDRLQSLYDRLAADDGPKAPKSPPRQIILGGGSAPAPSEAPSGQVLKTMAFHACEGMLDNLTMKQAGNSQVSRFVSDVVACVSKNGGFKLKLDKDLFVDDSLCLIIDGKEYGATRASFEGYDRMSKTIMLYCRDKELADAVMSHGYMQVFSDMKWLVGKTQSFFDSYGNSISYPPDPKIYAAGTMLTSINMNHSSEQMDAVSMSLSKPLSYVWGVPGSGKTQAVLAKAIYECVKRSERVAVIAPTNNALEQVIRGLIKAFNNELADVKTLDHAKDIMRIGTPTAEFMTDYPSVCEPRGLQTQLERKVQSLNRFLCIRSERRYESLKKGCKEAVRLARGARNDEKGRMEVYMSMKPLLDAMSEDPRYSVNAKATTPWNAIPNAERIYRLIYDRDRSQFFDEEILEMDDAFLDETIDKLRAEIDGIRKRNPNTDINSVKIVAMTLSKFIVSYGPYAMNGRAALEVDRVFVDEAGYCNDLQMLSLFTLNAPITMLGDHMQLPPVCEIDRRDLLAGIDEGKEHRYDFLWDLSALYVDHFFDKSSGRLAQMYRDSEDPDFPYTSRRELTMTYRFGPNLAKTLGKHVYGLDIGSRSPDPLYIEVVDAVLDRFPVKRGEVRRENASEADAVSRYLKDNSLSADDSFVIMAPYKDQVKCIKK